MKLKGDNIMREMLTWGLSMYGGYYAEIIDGGYIKGYHTEKLYELKRQMNELGLTLEKIKRFDN